ncbi:hypothetical protein [Mycolicibacterium wolinskyi]|uniref:hypothetical protein n=1 Tax=Mycolicibacterium wolinskyi TaxID=59750 RepID=UPI00391778AA
MSVPSLRPSTSLAFEAPDGFSRNESNQLSRLQNAELTRGLATATYVEAKGFVTMIGVQLVGALSREAECQSGGDPRVAERTNLLVDQFTMSVASAIGRL